MITGKFQLRPRYGEVDKMGYVYHANHVCYCHQARTELLRKLGIHDSMLEANNIMLPVISFAIDYKHPAHYDELLSVKTIVPKLPETRLDFEFEITNEKEQIVCTATSTVVFVDSRSMLPQKAPVFVINVLKEHSKAVYS